MSGESDPLAEFPQFMTDTKELAVQLHVELVELVEVGFTNEQAFEIVAQREACRIDAIHAIAIHGAINSEGSE